MTQNMHQNKYLYGLSKNNSEMIFHHHMNIADRKLLTKYNKKQITTNYNSCVVSNKQLNATKMGAAGRDQG